MVRRQLFNKGNGWRLEAIDRWLIIETTQRIYTYRGWHRQSLSSKGRGPIDPKSISSQFDQLDNKVSLFNPWWSNNSTQVEM